LIRVAVSGASGRMGREVVKAVSCQKDMELVAAIDREHAEEDSGVLAGIGQNGITVQERPGDVFDLSKPDVLVDFTVANSAGHISQLAIKRGVRPVIGTSGLTAQDRSMLRAELEEQGIGGMIVPNFAIGAVLMMKFAESAAKYFPNFEIIEMHHDGKLDAPSGTATRTAEHLSRCRTEKPRSHAREKVTIDGSRGGELAGVRIHSIRLPGLVAHQEVLFGGEGELLTIRHDSMNRASFMPGVLLAIRGVLELKGLTVGLEGLL